MKQVHVECKPDELLVSKLGFTKKYITHHQGKAKVFDRLKKSESGLAVVDEDPGTFKSGYEKSLNLLEERLELKLFSDTNNNKICILSGELEEWIIDVCNKAKINLTEFGLPENHRDFKRVILSRLNNFDKLLSELIQRKNPAIMQLKKWLR